MQLKKRLFIFTLSFLILTPEITAQTLITGKVSDEITNNPLLGVSVIIKELQKGTITDSEGKYSITVPYDNYTVLFSSISYKPLKKQINCNKNKVLLNAKLQPTSIQMKEVVVTAKSVAREIREQAMPISVITMKDLQGTVSDVSDVLSKTSGVTIRESGGTGSSSRISVRGLEGKRIGFFLDGIPLNDNKDFLDINDVPVDLIERIEIYKGIVPAKFGGSAIGGAVNIVLKEYPPTYMDASYSIQSFNTHKTSAIVKRNKNGIEGGLAAIYTYSDNNFLMKTPKEFGDRTVIRDHDKFEKITFGGSIISENWWFDEMDFEPAIIYTEKEIQGIEYNIQHAKSYSNAYLIANHNKKGDFLIDGLDLDFDNNYAYTTYRFHDKSMFTYNWDGTIKDTVFNELIGLPQGEIGDFANDTYIQKHNFYQKTNLNYVINNKNSVNLNSLYRYVKGIPEDKYKDKALGYKTNYNSTMNSWILGLSYEFNSSNQKFANMLNGKYYYYLMKTKLVDVIDINRILGDVEVNKSDFGVSNAIRYRFTPEFLVKASLSYDVRLPTDEELLGDGFLIIPSANLDPERITSFNLGFIYDFTNVRLKRFQFEINGFYMVMQDMIRFTGGALQSMYRNFGEMRTLGAEIEVKADVTNWLYLWGNATYQDLRDIRKYEAGSSAPNPTKGDRMPNIPYLFANAGFEIHKQNLFGGSGQNTRLFSDCSFVEEYFYDFEQSVHQEKRIPRALTFNAGLEHSFNNQNMFISFQANNITDARVLTEFNRPLPGRHFGMKVRYVLK